ncbi:MAG: hypothetical protein VYA34_03385 [Myxococcota bacterium]|nr:hypothetical protein [Myxococcota bacterium]
MYNTRLNAAPSVPPQATSTTELSLESAKIEANTNPDSWVARSSAAAKTLGSVKPFIEPGLTFPEDGTSDGITDDAKFYLSYIPKRVVAFFKAALISLVIGGKRLQAHLTMLTQDGPKPVEITTHEGVPGVLKVRPEEEADFLKYRSPLYTSIATTGVAKQDALDSCGRQKIKVVSDETFRKMILHTPLSHALPLDPENPKFYKLDLSAQFAIDTKNGTTYQVKTVRIPVNPINDERATIELDTGKVVEAPAPDEKSQTWDLAKLYFQMSWAHAVVGLFHTWVHFGVPDVAAASLTNGVLDGTIKEGSTLHNLLAPHLRFTMRINNQALNVGRFSAEEPLQMAHEAFTKTIAKIVAKEEIVIPRGRRSASPYEYFLHEYKKPIRKFVDTIASKIDPNEYQAWIAPLAEHYPGLAKPCFPPSMEEVLTDLIWQVSVVHSSDHHAAYKFRNYGVSTIPKKFSDASPDELADPTSLVDSATTTNFRTAVDIFAQHLDLHPNLDNRTASANYDFQGNSEKRAAQTLKSEIQALDTRMKKEGVQFCPATTMLQSVCL